MSAITGALRSGFTRILMIANTNVHFVRRGDEEHGVLPGAVSFEAELSHEFAVAAGSPINELAQRLRGVEVMRTESRHKMQVHLLEGGLGDRGGSCQCPEADTVSVFTSEGSGTVPGVGDHRAAGIADQRGDGAALDGVEGQAGWRRLHLIVVLHLKLVFRDSQQSRGFHALPV